MGFLTMLKMVTDATATKADDKVVAKIETFLEENDDIKELVFKIFFAFLKTKANEPANDTGV